MNNEVKRSPYNRVIVDNWLLEFATRLLDPSFDSVTRLAHDGYRGYYYRENEDFQIQEQMFVRDKLTALLHLIDQVVVSEHLIFNPVGSRLWAESAALEPIKPMLLSARELVSGLDQSSQGYVAHSLARMDSRDRSTVVEDGALYYTELAATLGEFYWPSPRRAEYLAQNHYLAIQDSFLMVLRGQVETSLTDRIEEITKTLGTHVPALTLPGFGAAVIYSTDSPANLLPNAMSLRNSKPCIAFRTWLVKMDQALKQGDMTSLARGLRDIAGVTAAIDSELGLPSRTEHKLEFSIGLSPSMTFDRGKVRSVADRLGFGPLHAVFLRQHFSQVLRNANLWNHVTRLWPDITPLWFDVI